MKNTYVTPESLGYNFAIHSLDFTRSPFCLSTDKFIACPQFDKTNTLSQSGLPRSSRCLYSYPALTKFVLNKYVNFCMCLYVFVTLGSILDYQHSKFYLARWSHRVALFIPYYQLLMSIILCSDSMKM